MNNFHYLIPKLLFFLIRWINAQGIYGTCNASFSCGSISGFQYPFRRHQDPEQCGYPGLELNCDQPKMAIINIMNINYRVLGMDLMTQVMKLVRGDMIGSVCPQDPVNTTIDHELFDYTASYTNITFLFKCPIPFAIEGVMASLLCAHNEASRAFVFPGAIGPGTCETSVTVPFPVGYMVSMGLIRTLQEGFEVRWKVESGPCTECTLSGGVCVYDVTRATTRCACPGSPLLADTCSKVNNETNNVSLSPQSSPSPSPSPGSKGATQKSKRKTKMKLVTGVLCAGITGIIVLVLVMLYYVKKLWETKEAANQIEISIRNNGTMSPKRFKYSEIKKMTNSFLEKLGQGGYGSVYKGQLPDGRLVAVKMLAGAKGYGEDFVNEVASISKTSHVNIVTLLGFCIDGKKKRALVYEFMPNGSLDKFLHGDGSHLDWNTLFLIAKGIARGLEYLHRGCNTRIVHFDIKPHNILLDDEFVPKISDFGLAKLCKKKESIVSVTGVRGTPGYIAPEVFFRTLGGVSHKSDVYSYGMMVLEMTGARKHNDCSSTGTGEAYFPDWIYKQIDDEEEEELARKMMIVSLWCIQSDPSDRPSIDKVVEMLEGSFESLQVPTKRVESFTARPFQSTLPSATQSIIQPVREEYTCKGKYAKC